MNLLNEKEFWKVFSSKQNSTQRVFEHLLVAKHDKIYRIEYKEDFVQSLGLSDFSWSETPFKIKLVDIYNPILSERMYFSDFYSLLKEHIIVLISDNYSTDYVLGNVFSVPEPLTALDTKILLGGFEFTKVKVENDRLVGFCKESSSEKLFQKADKNKYLLPKQLKNKYFV